MKKKQFNVFLQEEIDKIRLTIDNLNTLKSKLRNEAELLAQDPDSRKRMLDEYYKNKKRTIIPGIKRVPDDKLISFYVKQKTKEYNDTIAELVNLQNELIITQINFKKDNFVTLFAPSEITVKYLIKYGYQEQIPPHELLRKIILLSKLSITIEEKKNRPMTQYLKALGNLFNETLRYEECDKKAIEFILKKIYTDISCLVSEEELDKYLKQVTVSLDKHISTLTEEEQDTYRTIIQKNEQPDTKKMQVAVTKLNELVNENNKSLQVHYENAIQSLSQDQLLIIHSAFEHIQKEKNKNLVLMIKKAISDVISMSRYIEIGDGYIDPIANEVLLDERIDFLSYITRTIENKNQNEPLFSFLVDENTGYPFIIEDARAMDELSYQSIYEAINSIDKLTKSIIFKKAHTTIYQAEFNDITLMFATYKDKIIIITAANKITENVLTRDYYPLIIEQIKKKYDRKSQVVYSSIVERELDLSYFIKDERSFFKKKKDK
ncbi:MAG: hypothetical protein ACI4WW_07255 [Candidatus Coprovivens sp.]